jgi:hypothetical protein
MIDKKPTKEEILAALEKWMDTPAEYTGVSYHGDSEGMPAKQSELNQLNDIISDIVDFRFCTDYSGFSYIKQYPLLSKKEYEYFHIPLIPKHPSYEEGLEVWQTQEMDNSITDLADHIKSCSDMITLFMRQKRLAREKVDKNKKK